MSLLDMESLLDQAAETVENRPDFVNIDTACITREQFVEFKEQEKTAQKDSDREGGMKKGDKYLALVFQYKILETVEGGNENAPIRPGSLTSEQFMLTADSLPAIKQRIAQILGVQQEELVGQPLRDFMTVAKGYVVKKKYTKRSNSDFMNVSVIDSEGPLEE